MVVAEVRRVRRGEGIAIGAVLVAGLLLWMWALGSRTLQPYYATAVHSMSQHLGAFAFSGFDPAGVVAIDKTPLAFWTQALGVWVFGFHPWAIALVQVLEGVAGIFVLNRVVRRWAGPRTALLAAGLFALTPIVTAINRDNVPDTLLLLLLLLAAYFVTRAVETGATRWLVWAGAFVGLGFFAKMLAAWIVLPALALAYFLGAPGSPGRRVGRLAIAGVVTLAVSLAWPVFVSVWPGATPFVGSTTDGSIWQLIFGYNGLTRLVGGSDGTAGGYGASVGAGLGGSPGPLRLFDPEIGGQIAWLLPLALVTLVIAIFRAKGADARTRAGWALWGGWLVVGAGVFSFTGGIFHPYYTAELAPAIAAASAAGLATAWRWRGEPGPARFALPLAVIGTAALAFLLLGRTPEWLPWLRYVVLALAVVSLIAYFARGAAVALVAAIAAIVAGPAGYAVATVAQPASVLQAGDPSAGPAGTTVAGSIRTFVGPGGNVDAVEAAYVRYMDAAWQLSPGQAQVLAYAQRQAPAAPVTLAVEGGTYGADPFLLNTDARVAALGGYLGFDPTPTTAQLQDWVAGGRLRFVLLPKVFLEIGRSSKAPSGSTASEVNLLSERIGWTTHHCAPVAPPKIGPEAADAGVLFDCAAH